MLEIGITNIRLILHLRKREVSFLGTDVILIWQHKGQVNDLVPATSVMRDWIH